MRGALSLESEPVGIDKAVRVPPSLLDTHSIVTSRLPLIAWMANFQVFSRYPVLKIAVRVDFGGGGVDVAQHNLPR